MKRRRTRPKREFFECPHCGASVAVGSKACRECGSDAETGWQDEEEIAYQSLDIPQGFSPEDERAIPSGRRWWIPVVAIVVAIAMLIWVLRLW